MGGERRLTPWQLLLCRIETGRKLTHADERENKHSGFARKKKIIMWDFKSEVAGGTGGRDETMAEWLRRINSRRLWGDTAQWGPTSTIVCVSKFGGNKSSPAGVFFFFFFLFP